MNIHKAFENQLTTVASEFRENITQYRRVISVHHTDADGYSSGAIIKHMMLRYKTPFIQRPFNLRTSWPQFLTDLEKQISPNSAVIFSDLCPNYPEVIDLATRHPDLHIYILDHHRFPPDPKNPLPNTIYNGNPTQFGLDGLKQIAGATLNYLFAKEVDEKNVNLGMYAALGMGGDTLDHFEDYQSYNKFVIEDAAEHGQVEIMDGLCAFGGMHETLAKGLALSILPYVTQVEGSAEKAAVLVESWGISPKTKINDLTVSQAERIAAELNPYLKGQSIRFPKKQGLLHHQFEHAQTVSIFGYDKPDITWQLIEGKTAPTEVKAAYFNFMNALVMNLTAFMQIPKIETNHALIADVTGRIPPNAWSETASFATINHIYNPEKILLLGGKDTEDFKLSVRCSQKFIDKHQGLGANAIVKRLAQKIGGRGGGHGLAAGYNFSIENIGVIPKIIDQIIELGPDLT
jgi:RecJ-like exonuclease